MRLHIGQNQTIISSKKNKPVSDKISRLFKRRCIIARLTTTPHHIKHKTAQHQNCEQKYTASGQPIIRFCKQKLPLKQNY